MEKSTCHCKLSVVKALVEVGKIRTTRSASLGAALLDLDLAAIVDVVMRLTPHDFFKSMTSHDDHRIWQDVYRPYTSGGLVYLKLTVVEDVLVVSFKELSP